MDPQFWLARWETNKIGWHEKSVNLLLTKNFKYLAQRIGARIFVPLCGKSNDIVWLLDQGYQVVGVELSELAIKEVFLGMGKTPKITKSANFNLYQIDNLDLFVGNFFALTVNEIGPIDAIYDRAALVALPPKEQKLYSQHLLAIGQVAPQILVTLEYDQQVKQGPPFCVDTSMLEDHYQDTYQLCLLENKYYNVQGDRLGPHNEKVWHLKPRLMPLTLHNNTTI